MTDKLEKHPVTGFTKQQLMNFYWFVMTGDNEFMPHHRQDFLGVKWCARMINISGQSKAEANKLHQLYPRDRSWIIEFTSTGNQPVSHLRSPECVWYQGSYQWVELSEPTITGDIEQFKTVGAMVLLFESEWEHFTRIPVDMPAMVMRAGIGKTTLSIISSGVGVGKSVFFQKKLAASVTAAGQKAVRNMTEQFRKLGSFKIDDDSVDNSET
jgi:hypothetical protein